MKLRIRGDAVRLRLTQKEVAQIAEGHEVQESTSFGGGSKFIYTLEPTSRVAELESVFVDNILKVLVPTQMALAWAKGNEVALQRKVPLASGELFLLVEKDFACLKARDHAEDETDMFPNPNEAHGHCT